jgi:hypothetical protein
MKRLIEYFSTGTEKTRFGSSFGAEIETHILTADDHPISREVSDAIRLDPQLIRWTPKLELGRQLVELCVGPHPTLELLVEETSEALAALSEVSERFEAKMSDQATLDHDEALLYSAEWRDDLWTTIDGKEALEHLCRIASAQITIAVSPHDAIEWTNLLLRQFDREPYRANDNAWRAYIEGSRYPYCNDRYGGPEGFSSIGEYCRELAKHRVLMHRGAICDLPLQQVADPDISLFVRSVWWHYRLKRYGNTLALEVRPIPRFDFEKICESWRQVTAILGL